MLLRRIKSEPEFFLILVVALVGLPLLRTLAALYPQASSLLVFVLFLVPGAAAAVLLNRDGSPAERFVFAFVASLGLCGVPAQAAITLQTNLSVYIALFAALTILLVLAAIAVIARRTLPERAAADSERPSIWLLLLVALVAGIILWFWIHSPQDGDQWDNLGWTQSLIADQHMFLVEPRFGLAPVSPRFMFSAWLVQQAMMSVVSGANLVDLSTAIQFPLILLSLAAVFGLARRISKNKNAALFMTIVWGLYLLVWNEGTVAGYEIIVRSSLDKVIGGFIIVPFGLGIVLDYFETRRRSLLITLLIVGVAAGLTHPITGALFALSLAGLAIIQLVLRRDRRALFDVSAVTVILLLSLISSVYLLVWGIQNPGKSLVATSLTDTRDPSLFLEIGGTLNKERIYVLDSGAYIMHPRLILQPINIAAYLLLPFLFLQLRRSRAAQYLVGALLFSTLVVLIPPVADLLGSILTPSLMYRLHWPLSLAAALTVGWAAWLLLQRISRPRWQGLAAAAPAAAALVIALPALNWNLTWLNERKIDPQGNYCTLAAPLLKPFQQLLTSHTLVMGDSEATDFCLIAYAPLAHVVEFHGTNGIRTFIYTGHTDDGWQRLYDAEYYQNATMVDVHLLDILHKWNVGYVISGADSELDVQLRHMPAHFRPVLSAFDRRVYQVVSADSADPLARANSALRADQLKVAADQYAALLSDPSPDTRYLAAIGLGQARFKGADIAGAQSAWKQASDILPDAYAFALQGEAYAVQLDRASALAVYQKAVGLEPANGKYLARLGDLSQLTGQTALAEQSYRAAAAKSNPPGTSQYYAALGDYWMETGAWSQAQAAYEQANHVREDSSYYERLGQVEIARQNWSVAEADFRKMSALDLWDWEPHTQLGTLYLLQNDLARAEAEFRDSLRLNPISADAYQGLATTWAAQQGPPSAVTLFEHLVGYRLGFGPARLALSNLQARAGNTTAGMSESQKAIDWYRLGVSYYRASAGQQLDAGLLDSAAETYRQVLALNGADMGADLGLSQIAQERGEPAAAGGYALMGALAAPNDDGPALAYGQWLEGQGRISQAAALYHDAAGSPARSAAALIGLGLFQIRQAQNSDAVVSFNSALSLAPDQTAALRGLALAQQNLGRMQDADRTLRQATAIHPGEGATRGQLADLVSLEGDNAQAIALLEQGIQVDPGSSPLYGRLQDAYSRSGLMDKAAAAGADLVEKQPAAAEGYLSLAQLKEQQGDTAGGLEILSRGIDAVSPGRAALLLAARADAERHAGHFDQAQADYEKAMRDAPGEPSVHVGAAEFYRQRGELEQARHVIENGLAIVPGDSKLLAAKAIIVNSQGNILEATQTYEAAVSLAPGDVQAVAGLAALDIASGHPAQAVGRIQAAQSRIPGSDGLLVQLTKAQLANGRPQDALSEADRLEDLAPGSAATWLTRGDTFAVLGQADQALDAYRHATAAEPGNSITWLSLGQYLMRQGKNADAQQAFDRAAQLDRTQAAPHLQLASLFDRAGNPSGARDEYTAAAAADATNGEAWLGLQDLARLAGALDSAQAYSSRALAASPTDADVYASQAALSLQQGQFEQARQALVRATELVPGSCPAWRNLGNYDASRGGAVAAETEYNRALAATGCPAESRVALGNLRLMQNKPVEAVDLYKQAIAASPADALGYVALADAYMTLGQRDEATRIYERAVGSIPASDLIYAAQGRSLLTLGKPDQALTVVKKAAALNPANALDLVELGQVYELLGQPQDALSAFEQAAQIDHTLPDSHLAAAALLARNVQEDKVVAEYRASIAADPANPTAYVALASYLQSRNRISEAIDTLKQGIAANAGRTEALAALGKLYESQGRLADAQQTLGEASRVGGDGATASTALVGTPADNNSPALAPVYYALGNLFQLERDQQAGQQAYQRALVLAPFDVQGYLSLARIAALQGQVYDAQSQYEQAQQARPTSAEVYVQEGDLDRSQANWQGAENAYRQAVAASPADPSGYIGLGKTDESQGRYGDALAQYAAAARANPLSPDPLVQQGLLHSSRAEWQAAEDAFRRAIQIAPSDPAAYLGWGDALLKQGKPAEALAEYRTGAQAAPAFADLWAAQGKALVLSGDWKGGEAAYRQAIQIAPLDPEAYIGLGNTFQSEGKSAEALAQYQAGSKANPSSPEAYAAAGDWYLLHGNAALAEDSYQEAVRVAPIDPAAHIGLAHLYETAGDLAAARAELETGIRLAPASSAPLLALGEYYGRQGDYLSGEQSLQKAITVNPTAAEPYIALAGMYQLQARAADALAAFQSGELYASDAGTVYLAQGKWDEAKGDLAGARSMYEKAAASSFSAEPLVALADLTASEGTVQEALVAYQNALKLMPGDPEPYVHLGKYLELRGRPQEALALYRSAAGLVPGSSSIYVALGSWYQSQGDLQNAEQAYRRAIELSALDPQGYIGLAQVLQSQARWPEAEQALKSAALATGGQDIAMTQGNYYLQRANLPAAGETFVRAGATWPGEIDSRIESARLDEWQGRFPQAESALKELAALAPGWPATYVALGDFYTGQREFDLAEQNYRRAIALEPLNDDARDALVRLSLLQNKLDRAIEDARSWLQIAPAGDARPLLALARVQREQGDWTGSLNSYDRALVRQPGNVDAISGKAQTLKAQGNSEQALALLNAGINVTAGSLDLRLLRGQTYEVLGRGDLARQDYAAAAAAHADSADPFVAEAKLALADQDRTRGIQFYRQAISAQPTNVQPYLSLADVYLQDQDTTDAVDVYRQALPNVSAGLSGNATKFVKVATYEEILVPDQLKARLGLANAQISVPDMAIAVQELNDSLSLWPRNSALILSLLGDVNAAFGQYPAAHDYYQKARAADPQEILAYLGEGDLYLFKEDNPDKALDLFNQAAAIDPSLPEIADSIISVYARQRFGHPTLSITCPHYPVIRDCDIQPGDVTVHTGLSSALQQQLEASAQANPNSLATQIQLASFYGAFQMGDQAIAQWKHVLTLDPANAWVMRRLAILYGAKETGRMDASHVYDQAMALGLDTQDEHNTLADLHHDQILAPQAGEVLRGKVELRGTADASNRGYPENFQSFKIEIGKGSSPTEWSDLFVSTAPITNGILFDWDTTTVANGVYTLRIRVIDQRGDYKPWQTVTVEVRN